MQITVNTRRVFSLLDALLARWTANPKRFPFNLQEAVVPQRLIPEELRNDTYKLVCFYFYACIYMRGGIESAQAFRALIKMWREHPYLFDPYQAQWLSESRVRAQLKRYIGWDSHSASISWVENSRRLMQYWDGDPRNLLKGLRDYDEAVRRIRNKRNKKEQRESGYDGLGFRGFQYKMVSMFIYFCDWEGLLERRFLYPAPADFHNFRLALAHRGIVLDPQPEWIRANEKLSKEWRNVLMKYLRARRADPVEVADAIWLFSLVLCGASPLTEMRSEKTNGSGMFAIDALPHDEDLANFSRRYREQAKRTCLSCPIVQTCELAIPAGPYYQRGNGFGGKLYLRDRFRMEEALGTFNPDQQTTPAAKEPPAHPTFAFLEHNFTEDENKEPRDD